MNKSVSVRELEERIKKIENEAGRWVTRYRITEDGSVLPVEFADVGPHDRCVINVYGCRPELCVQRGRMKLAPVEVYIPEERLEEYEQWLYDNLEEQNAPVNISGIRKVVLPVPEFIDEAVKAALSAPED